MMRIADVAAILRPGNRGLTTVIVYAPKMPTHGRFLTTHVGIERDVTLVGRENAPRLQAARSGRE